MASLLRMYERFLQVVFMRDGEGEDERMRKRAMVSILLGGLAVSCASNIGRPATGLPRGLLLVFPILVVLMLLYIACTRSLSITETEVITAVLGLRVCVFGDFENYGNGNEWATSILMLDCFLLFGCRLRTLRVCMWVCIAECALQAIMHAFDTGIYESLPQLSDAYSFEREGMRGVEQQLIRVFVLYSAITLTVYF
eukprot:Sspe_Gene.119790::Locus_116672_Transcript_1_1_Confidence_1.000_Length_638::g.119790::m.119790